MARTLSRMKDILLPSANQDRLVIWAIACSAFFGFFRLGEILPSSMAEFNPATSLSWGDVAVDNHDYPRMVQFHLKRSKCDQFGAGSDMVVGVTGSPLCPVSAILTYIAARSSTPGPFFLDSRGKAALKPWFVAQILSRSASRLTNTLATVSGLEQQPPHHWQGYRTLPFRPSVDGAVLHSFSTSECPSTASHPY